MRFRGPCLAICLFLLAAFFSIPAQATLVAIAPTRNGIVIAADSRLTFLGSQCDGAFKIVVPARPMRTVVVVTGDSVFVAPPPAGTSNVCGYLAAAPRLLDIGAVVASVLEAAAEGPADISTGKLSAACVRAVERFRGKHPKALRAYAGREVFSVVVASYDPVQAATVLRRFAVKVDGGDAGAVMVTNSSEMRFDGHSKRDVWIFGETDWVKQTVFEGRGRQFLNAETIEFLGNRGPVGEVERDQAVAVVTNVIDAASRAAETSPPPSGIGGAIHVMVVGAGPRAETVR